MAVLTPPSFPQAPADESRHGKQPEHRWRKKFRAAARGIKLGIRGHSSFSVHFFVSAMVITAAAILRCTLEQWCLLLGAIGMVLTAELFNSAVETLFRHLDEETKQRAWPCLDIAAGAVLLVSLFAAVIGVLVFVAALVHERPP